MPSNEDHKAVHAGPLGGLVLGAIELNVRAAVDQFRSCKIDRFTLSSMCAFMGGLRP